MTVTPVDPATHLKVIDDKHNRIKEALDERHLPFALLLLDEVGPLLKDEGTSHWGGPELHDLVDRTATYEMLRGRYRLIQKDMSGAIESHQKASSTIAHQSTSNTAQIRVANAFHSLRAQAAAGAPIEKRSELYLQLTGLTALERFRAWMLTYFGRIGYKFDERFFARSL